MENEHASVFMLSYIACLTTDVRVIYDCNWPYKKQY
jgi:hypothetical protein